jgi:hypothetical protein
MTDRGIRPSPSVTVDRYFLDESGHGGDLASAKNLDFAGQPFFALVCVGAADAALLAAELDRLRVFYACGEGELKSAKLGKKLAPISQELITFLVRQRWPLFVELVDKRFFIAAHVVNHLLCGPYGLDNVDMAGRNTLSVTSVAAVIDLLWHWLDRSDSEIARTAQVLTMFARDRVRKSTAKAEDFLPIADESATGKKVWMLPNLQSLTNIYARLNQSRPVSLDGAQLVHDEQMQYAKVLEDSKALMEQLAAEAAVPIVPFADYHLRGRGNLVFATGKIEPCLQAADILAGCAMRFARDGQARKGRVDTPLRAAFDQMIDAGNPMQATGINLVMSARLLETLGIPHIPADIVDRMFPWG